MCEMHSSLPGTRCLVTVTAAAGAAAAPCLVMDKDFKGLVGCQAFFLETTAYEFFFFFDGGEGVICFSVKVFLRSEKFIRTHVIESAELKVKNVF